MAKLLGSGPFPKRIEEYVVYRLPGIEEPILRLNTGFESKSWRTADKYAKSRWLASEFGALIRVCKLFREGLDLVLPRYNRKGICNHLVKKLYPFIAMDGVSVWGERCLSEAFKCAEFRAAMVGFDFNPQSKFYCREGTFLVDSAGLNYHLQVGHFLEQLVFPTDSACGGVQLHRYVFDFGTGRGVLVSGDLCFIHQDSVLDVVSLPVPIIADCHGVDFLLFSVSFFEVDGGGFGPVLDCGDGGVRVLECGMVRKI